MKNKKRRREEGEEKPDDFEDGRKVLEISIHQIENEQVQHVFLRPFLSCTVKYQTNMGSMRKCTGVALTHVHIFAQVSLLDIPG